MTPQSKTVLVTVGTDHHPFNRLMTWSEHWVADHPDVNIVVQHGSSRAPASVPSYERISHEKLSSLMEDADVIVTHGGGGSITQCWRAGKVPLVVARRKHLGEHVDDHQVAFANRLAEMGYVRKVSDEETFASTLSRWVSSDRHEMPTIDVDRPTETTLRIGEMIEELLRRRSQR